MFDGVPTDLKQATINARRKVRDDAGERWMDALKRGDEAEAYKQARSSTRVDTTILETSKELLRLMGIPVVQAPGRRGGTGSVYGGKRRCPVCGVAGL